MVIAIVVGLVIGCGAVAEGDQSDELRRLRRQFDDLLYEKDLGGARAVLRQHPEIAGEISFENYHGSMLLSYAGSDYSIEVLEMLLDAGANVHAVDNDGRTALHHAAWCDEDDPRRVGFFVDRGVSLHGRDRLGSTALHFAVEEGNVAIACWLIEQGIDLDARDAHGRSALHRWLSPYPRGGMNADDPFDMARALLDRGADINARDAMDTTPLMAATFAGWAPALAWYIEQGADPSLVDADGRTALHHLAIIPNPQEAKRYLRRSEGIGGARWDRLTHQVGGMGMAMMAARPIAEAGLVVLEHTDDVDAKDHAGDTPLGLLVRSYENALWAPIVDPTSPDAPKELAHWRAQKFVDSETAGFIGALREAGADPEAVGADGRTVVDVVRSLDEPYRTEILKALGEDTQE